MTSSSRTVIWGSTPPDWATYPQARRTPAGSFARSHPATVAAPPVGGSSVVSIRRVVVLPAPVGPEEAEDLPLAHGQVDAAHGLDGAVPGAEGTGQTGGR
ncbi:hypothetical protein SFUMM280S_00662 [Streptomyces fumanus]